jgi:hypothetical protein
MGRARTLWLVALMMAIAIAAMGQPQQKSKTRGEREEDRKVAAEANEALREIINGLSKRALVPGRKVFIQLTGKRQLDRLLAKDLRAWERWEVVLNEEKADLIIKTLTSPCTIIDAHTKERLYIALPGPNENLVKRIQKELESLTLSKYLEIREGMTYAEVTAIVGRPGVEQSSNNIGGIKTVLYEWRDGMTAMNAMFQNAKLIQKAQFGLK